MLHQELSLNDLQEICHKHRTLNISQNLSIGDKYPKETHIFDELDEYIQSQKYQVLLFDEVDIRIANDLQWCCPELQYIICNSDKNFKDIISKSTSQLSSPKLWDFIGFKANNKYEASGFKNSFDGAMLTPDEIQDLVNNTIKKLQPYLTPKTRILEIGCAGGLLLDALLPLVKSYTGIDQSSKMIEKTKTLHKHHKTITHFEHMSANEIQQLNQQFDIIIINSVVQYFSDLNYFRDVINQCIKLLSNHGIVFLGDLMNATTKTDLVKATKSYSMKNENHKTKTRWQDELFVHPDFLLDLELSHPQIDKVTCHDKFFTIENELSKFRFDAIIHKNSNKKMLLSSKNYQFTYGGTNELNR